MRDIYICIIAILFWNDHNGITNQIQGCEIATEKSLRI